MTTPYTGPSMPLRFAFDPGAPVSATAIANPPRENTFTLQSPNATSLVLTDGDADAL